MQGSAGPPSDARLAARYQANIWKFYLFQFLLNFQLWWPIWVIYLTEERGLSLGQVTLIDVPFWGSIIALQIPAAAIADRWGRRPTLLAGALFFSIAVTVFGLATSFELILVSYLIWGVGFALLGGTESAFLYDTLKALGREDEYPRVYGRAWGLVFAAAMAGTLLGAPVAKATDLSFPIVVSGGIAFLAVLAAASFTEPRLEGGRRRHLSYGQIIGESVEILRRRPAVRYSVLFYGLITIGSIGPIFFFQPFLRQHGIGLGEVGLWQTPTRIAGIIGAVAAYRIIAALGERRTFYLMPAVLFASWALLAVWDSVYAQVAFPVMSLVVALSQPTVTDYLNRRVPTDQRATVVSLTNLARSAVLVPSAPLLGQLADRASLRASYWAGGALIAALALPLLALWSPLLRRSGEAEEVPEPAASAPAD
ncbi:MAG: MFS transporter [Dehalococcoidia bacterium]|nr:MFS transporter [Dehalococcoidia bacterium]